MAFGYSSMTADANMATAATDVTADFNDAVAEALDIDCYLKQTTLSNGQTAYLFYCKTFDLTPVTEFYEANKAKFDYAFGEMRALLKTGHNITSGETFSDLSDNANTPINEIKTMADFGFDLEKSDYVKKVGRNKYYENGELKYIDIPYEDIFANDSLLFYWLKLNVYKFLKYGDYYASAVANTSLSSYGTMLSKISEVFNSYSPFEKYLTRIHYNTPYYLIDGVVSNGVTGEAGDTYTQKGMFGVANNNTTSAYGSEIETAGDGAKWVLSEVDGGADNYFGVKASLQGKDGKYYTTLYVDFPIDVTASQEVSDGMHFYTIGDVQQGTATDGTTYNYAEVTEQTSTIDEGTPLVVECSSTDASDNKIVPAQSVAPVDRTEFTATHDGLLQGTYFNLGKSQYDSSDETKAAGYGRKIEKALSQYIFKDSVEAESQSELLIDLQNRGGFDTGDGVIYTLQKNSSDTHNPMGFYKYTGYTLAKNKCFVLNPTVTSGAKIFIGNPYSGTTGISGVESNGEQEADVIYDLQGHRINNVDKAGLYIVNGKKVMIFK